MWLFDGFPDPRARFTGDGTCLRADRRARPVGMFATCQFAPLKCEFGHEFTASTFFLFIAFTVARGVLLFQLMLVGQFNWGDELCVCHHCPPNSGNLAVIRRAAVSNPLTHAAEQAAHRTYSFHFLVNVP